MAKTSPGVPEPGVTDPLASAPPASAPAAGADAPVIDTGGFLFLFFLLSFFFFPGVNSSSNLPSRITNDFKNGGSPNLEIILSNRGLINKPTPGIFPIVFKINAIIAAPINLIGKINNSINILILFLSIDPIPLISPSLSRGFTETSELD